MRRSLSTVFFILLFLTLFAEVRYKFGGDTDYPPFEYANDRGAPVDSTSMSLGQYLVLSILTLR